MWFTGNIASGETKFSFKPRELMLDAQAETTDGEQFSCHLTVANMYNASQAVLVHRERDGTVHCRASLHEDQIKKDNSDPMPSVRLVAALSRTCRWNLSNKFTG